MPMQAYDHAVILDDGPLLRGPALRMAVVDKRRCAHTITSDRMLRGMVRLLLLPHPLRLLLLQHDPRHATFKSHTEEPLQISVARADYKWFL